MSSFEVPIVAILGSSLMLRGFVKVVLCVVPYSTIGLNVPLSDGLPTNICIYFVAKKATVYEHCKIDSYFLV